MRHAARAASGLKKKGLGGVGSRAKALRYDLATLWFAVDGRFASFSKKEGGGGFVPGLKPFAMVLRPFGSL